MRNLLSILEDLKFGETVLVEYSSKAPVYLLFHELIKWSKENNYPVLVDDFLDTLHMYKVQMEIAGIDTSPLKDLNVIKMGGSIKIGNILGKISVTESAVLEGEYDKIFNKLSEDKIINPVLGFDKLFILYNDRKDYLNAIYRMLKYLGNKKRIAFYFINVDLIKSTFPEILPIMEEIATAVISIEEKDEFRINIRKPLNI
ncbi:hypothetical protein DRN34_05910 [Thermococci archaeon]|nr:MAG: hypothetical protein DRN34_05910 [Thermococci archaeon]